MNAASHILMIAAAALVTVLSGFVGIRTILHYWRANDLEGFCVGIGLCVAGLLMVPATLALIGGTV